MMRSNRREFVASLIAAGLLPSSVLAAKVDDPLAEEKLVAGISELTANTIGQEIVADVLTEKAVNIVWSNNVYQMMQETPDDHQESLAKVQEHPLFRVITREFLQETFDIAQGKKGSLLTEVLGSEVPVFTIEAMELPAWLIERGDKRIPVVATARKLRARFTPDLWEDLTCCWNRGDLDQEVKNILTDQIGLEIGFEMATWRRQLQEGELVFCPYNLPVISPKLEGKPRGLLMRYAIVFFPQDSEPIRLV